MNGSHLPTVVASTLLRTMVHLDLGDDVDWEEAEASTLAALSSAGDPAEVLTAVVRATMIIDQFLLEIACRPSEGRPSSAVISSAGRLVHDVVTAQASRATTSPDVRALVRTYGVEVYSFGRFRVDCGRRTVRADGARVPLTEPHWRLLVCLLVNRDRIVGHDELRKVAGIAASSPPDALAAAVNSLRRDLDDSSSRQDLIRTASGRGYQFVGAVHLSRRTRYDGES